ncbi:hypothetical protein PAQ31011_01958 [Pandoraea aquatica]|uniref:Tetratricopeptide repeat protein n=1 Tax=Pandoraea aquatica TaxID=2508290 RepID=A0A5E4UET9_9BURK|nr:hypothetical protein [Pandoraea aquatica]VVD97374.1 hypothetical protein PAQ31011_01958 [Pandoraea aquatica]
MEAINASASPLLPSSSSLELSRRRQRVLERFNEQARNVVFPSEREFTVFLHEFTRTGLQLAPCLRASDPEKSEALRHRAICHIATFPGGRVFLTEAGLFHEVESAALSLWQEFSLDARQIMLDDATLSSVGCIVVNLPDCGIRMPLGAPCFSNSDGALSGEACARLLLSRDARRLTLLHRFVLSRSVAALGRDDRDIVIAWTVLLRHATDGARIGAFLPSLEDMIDLFSAYGHLNHWANDQSQESRNLQALLLVQSAEDFGAADVEMNPGFIWRDIAFYWASVGDREKERDALASASVFFDELARRCPLLPGAGPRRRRLRELALITAQQAADMPAIIEASKHLFLVYREQGRWDEALRVADRLIEIARQYKLNKDLETWTELRAKTEALKSGIPELFTPHAPKAGDGPPPPPHRT